MTAFRSMTAAAHLLAIALILSGCQREEAQEPLSLSGRLFIFNYRIAQANYVLTLARNAPLPEGSVVETSFEDPKGGAPIVTRTRIFPHWQKISLESPPVHCIVKDRTYAVSIRVLDGKGELIQRIDTSVTSTLDQSVLPAKPLVVGPIYTKNPEVFRVDGTVDYAPENGCPAR